MDRQRYYYRQKVTDADLSGLEDNLEAALASAIVDLFGTGIVAGGDLKPTAPAAMSVQVTPGKGYDFLGQRIAWAQTQVVDCSKDYTGKSTAVTATGNEKWLTVMAYFVRELADPRVDGHGNIVHFRELESYELRVVQGVEASQSKAVKPGHPTDGGLILGDILLPYGASAITAGMIDASRHEDITIYTADLVKVLDSAGQFAGQNVEVVLAELKNWIDQHSALKTSAHGGIVPASDVSVSATAGKLLRLDGSAKLPASITGDADTVDGKHAAAFAPAGHVGAGGSAHPTATQSAAGFLSMADKAKLDSIKGGAEPNQAAFSRVTVGGTAIDAQSATDAVAIKAGAGVQLSPDAAARQVTIAAAMTDETHGSRKGATLHSVATSTESGFMSSGDKKKLDGIAEGAEINQNAYTKVNVATAAGTSKGQANASSKLAALTLKEGSNVTLSVMGETVTVSAAGGKHSNSHVTGGDDAIPVATSSVDGLMAAADKAKLDSVKSGAEVNQNAFSVVEAVSSAGTSRGKASSSAKTDTVTLKEGAGISLDVSGKAITVGVVGGTTPAVHGSDHISGGRDAIPNATANGSSGLMSGADKAKLDAVQTGAEKNQNAYSRVVVGSTPIDAGSASAQIELAAGSNIVLSPDAAQRKVTIGLTGTVPKATNADTVGGKSASAFVPAAHVGSGGTAHAVATTSVAGFLSAQDKSKLDGIAAGAEKNQNAYSRVQVGGTAIDATASTSAFKIGGGTNVSVTLDTANGQVNIAGTGTWPNADTVDGLHGTQFVRSDVDSTMAGKLHLSAQTAAPKITAYSVADAATYTIVDKDAKIWRAVYNDLAEFMRKAENGLEPGDVLVWEGDGVARTAEPADARVVGVYSDTYGLVIGGEETPNADDNLDKYAPVAMAGRVRVKAIGPVQPGDLLVSARTPGYAEATIKPTVGTVVGKALESLNDGETGRVWALVMAG